MVSLTTTLFLMPNGQLPSACEVQGREYTAPVLRPFVTASIFALAVSAQTPAVLPGIETFLADVPAALRGKRVALITNHTGIDRSRRADIDLIAGHQDLELV